jgi:hypothetical protein
MDMHGYAYACAGVHVWVSECMCMRGPAHMRGCTRRNSWCECELVTWLSALKLIQDLREKPQNPWVWYHSVIQ